MEKELKFGSKFTILKNKIKRFFRIKRAEIEYLTIDKKGPDETPLIDVWDLTLQLYEFVKDIPFEDRKTFLMENLPKNAEEYIVDYILDIIEIIEREKFTLGTSKEKEKKQKENAPIFFPTLED